MVTQIWPVQVGSQAFVSRVDNRHNKLNCDLYIETPVHSSCAEHDTRIYSSRFARIIWLKTQNKFFEKLDKSLSSSSEAFRTSILWDHCIWCQLRGNYFLCKIQKLNFTISIGFKTPMIGKFRNFSLRFFKSSALIFYKNPLIQCRRYWENIGQAADE